MQRLRNNKLEYVMPILTPDELKDTIAAGDIFAVSIDTDVFDAKGKRFDNSVLRSLDQFKGGNIEFVIADVVAREIKAHLQEDAAESQRALNRTLRAHNSRWRRENSERERESLLIFADPAAFAESEFARFLKNTDCKVLNFMEKPGSVHQIFDRYFSEKPPFGPSKNRKSEFPDAFALHTLENYAVIVGKSLLFVSADKGWLQFAKQSDHLVCVPKLEDALTIFNEAYQHLAETIVQKWIDLESYKRIEAIEESLRYYLDFLDFYISANTEVPFEAEPLSAELQSLDTESISRPQVIKVDDDTVTFFVRVEASVYFEAKFEFYVLNNVEKDHVDIALTEEFVETQVPFDLTIRADRDLRNVPAFREVDVTSAPIDVDFGYIDSFG